MAVELRVIFCVLVGLQVCQGLKYAQNRLKGAEERLQPQSSSTSRLSQLRIDLPKNLIDLFFKPISEPPESRNLTAEPPATLLSQLRIDLYRNLIDLLFIPNSEHPESRNLLKPSAKPPATYKVSSLDDLRSLLNQRVYGHSLLGKRADDAVQSPVVKRSPQGPSFLGKLKRFHHSFDVDYPKFFSSP